MGCKYNYFQFYFTSTQKVWGSKNPTGRVPSKAKSDLERVRRAFLTDKFSLSDHQESISSGSVILRLGNGRQ